jgi:hypothetical protein
MPVTAAQLEQFRRMVAEPTAATYTDDVLESYIEARPVMDARGVPWEDWNYSATPPTLGINPNWLPTYDMNAAAADIWDEKAANAASCISFSADGASYSLAEKIANYSKMASKYRSRARIGSVKLVSKQRELTQHNVVVETIPTIDQFERSGVFNQ